jgi:Flp pilus assembly protein TadG
LASRRHGRRGGNAIEFALTLPIFVFIMFGVLEYGYYFYLSALVEDANRFGCRKGALVDPAVGDPAATAASEIQNRLENDYNLPCDLNCEIVTNTVTYGVGTVDTPEHLRVADEYTQCQVTYPYTQTIGLMNLFPTQIESKMIIRLEFQE